MATFQEANQARVKLKMKLSDYYWYSSSEVLFDEGDYYVRVLVKNFDKNVKKKIPFFVNEVFIRADLE